MAKKDKEEQSTPGDFTDQILAQVEKDYGVGTIVSGDEAANETRVTIPWSPALDAITGGVEEGSWVGITGHEKMGKSAAALALASNAQKPEYGSRPVYYSKVEGRLALNLLKGVRGLDLSKGRFNIIQSTEDRILTTQDHLTILTNVIRTVPNAFVIIDSISAFCDEKEMNEGVGTETRGGGAKLFSQWCRLMNQVVPVRKTIVVGITQLISNTSGMGAQYMERAARMWKYQADYQLRAKMKRAWKGSGEKQIGLEIDWVCNTSKTLNPGLGITGYLRFGRGEGVDRLYETIQLAMVAGLIKKAGAWLQLSFLDDQPKFQGQEKVYEALKAHPEWAEQLQSLVSETVGGIVSQESS